MVEPVTLTTIGALVSPIITDLVKGALEDYAKDFFKDAVKDLETVAQKPFARDAVREAIREFASLFLQQLAQLGLKEKELKPFVKPLQHFVKEPTVRQVLGTAFSANCQQVDAAKLRDCWQTVRCGGKAKWLLTGTPQSWIEKNPEKFYGKLLPAVPAGFDWQKLGEDYRLAVREIVRQDEDLRKIFDSQNQERTADAVERLAGVPKDFDLLAYREGLREQYNHLDFGSLDAQAGNYERTLTLQEIFLPQKARECQEYMPQVHELPVEVRRQMRERGDISAEELAVEQLERVRRTYSQQSPKSILEIVEDSRYRYIVVLGDPGAGKSTLLKYLALQWAKLETQALTSQPVPLLIELRKYVQSKTQGECRDFLEFINGASTWIGHLPQNRLHEWLKGGRCLALFDGLDEVFDPQLRSQVIAQIHNFTQTYPDVKVVVTSRVIGYQPQKLKNAQFYHFMLEEFDEEQIDEFVRRWHELTFTDRLKKAAKLERLQKELAQRRTIRELAGNPLLLTMIAILNRNQELPRNRVKLYQEASKVLLHKWDVDEKQLKPGEAFDTYFIDEEVKQGICRQIAYRMQSGEKGLRGNVIEKEALRESIAEALTGLVGEKAPTYAKWMVEQLRERNFILCYLGGNHEDYYAFVHRTFLEYFCAWAFVWQFEKERSIDLAYLKTEVFGRHWQDESWHEVLRLMAGMLDGKFAGEVIEFLMGQTCELQWDNHRLKKGSFLNLLLAADCMDEVKNRNAITQLAGILLDRLKAIVTRKKSEQLSWEAANAVLEVIATYWKNHPDTLPWLKSTTIDTDSDVRYAAVKVIASGWKDDPNTLPWLKQATQKADSTVRRAAIQAISSEWKDDPNTLPWLKQATQNADSTVRWAAVQAIVTGWKDDPDTLPLVKSTITDADEWVRQAAVQAIASGWKDDPETLPWLKRATSDENSNVRRAALEAIISEWKDDPETLPWLKNLALFGKNVPQNLRQTAVEELVKHWKDSPDLLPWFISVIESSPDWVVQVAAMKALVKEWKDNDQTLPLLKGCIHSDRPWYVRGSALYVLTEYWKEDSDTVPILKTCAQCDCSFIRLFALQALVQYWQDDAEIADWMKTVALSHYDPEMRETILVRLAQEEEERTGSLSALELECLAEIKSIAQSDEDLDMRHIAIEGLGYKQYKDEPGIFELLSQVALTDPFIREKDWQDNPRQIALEAILNNYADQPEVVEILRDRSINDSDEPLRQFAQKKLAELFRYN